MMRSTVDAAVVVWSVPEDQVTGFRRLDGDGDGLEVAHLADEQDVGVLTQCRTQRALERLGMRPHLALVDETVAALVDELDRILDGDDVIAGASG